MTTQETTMPSAEQAIRDLNATWIDAVNAGELDRLLQLVTDDVVLLNPGGAPVDREGFAATFADAHRRFHFRCASVIQSVTVAGDVAYAVCRDTLSIAPRAGGEAMAYAGHRLSVYRRAVDGGWRLARYPHTLLPVAVD